MELQDIIALAHAGFTAQQIAVFAQQPVQKAVQHTQQPAQQPAQQPEQQPAQPQSRHDSFAQQLLQNTQLDPIMQQLQQISGMIQQNNINSFQQPEQESVDSILASIINPPKIDKE